MGQAGKNAAFARGQPRYARGAAVEQFQRDALGEIGALALGQEDHAHAAGANFAQQGERSDLFGHAHLGKATRGGHGRRAVFRADGAQRTHGLRKLRIGGGDAVELRGPRGRVQCVQPIDQRTHLVPAIGAEQRKGRGGHAGPSSASVR